MNIEEFIMHFINIKTQTSQRLNCDSSWLDMQCSNWLPGLGHVHGGRDACEGEQGGNDMHEDVWANLRWCLSGTWALLDTGTKVGSKERVRNTHSRLDSV